MNAYSTKKVESAIKKVIHYYHFFDYAPSFDLIYKFFPFQISKKGLQNFLNQMTSNNRLILHTQNRKNIKIEHINNTFDICYLTFDVSLYTLPQYSISINKQIKKCQISNVKFQKIRLYIKLITAFSTIQMVGITGSASMGNCKKNDDIDLCIVTKTKSLWITRFMCIVLAKLMGLYGKHVCLNLFFDESNLLIPKQKQTIYIGHELLQMKPVVNKNKTYERMLSNNIWINILFPNVRIKKKEVRIKNNTKKTFFCLLTSYFLLLTSQTIELLFKTIQLPLIRKNKTALFITPTQLWLFKRDFEKKLRNMKVF